MTIPDFFKRKRMTSRRTEDDLAYERSWIGTEEDEQDFLDMTDQYLRMEVAPTPSQEGETQEPRGAVEEEGGQEDGEFLTKEDDNQTPRKSSGIVKTDWEKLFEDTWTGAVRNQEGPEEDYVSKDDFLSMEKKDTLLEFGNEEWFEEVSLSFIDISYHPLPPTTPFPGDQGAQECHPLDQPSLSMARLDDQERGPDDRPDTGKCPSTPQERGEMAAGLEPTVKSMEEVTISVLNHVTRLEYGVEERDLGGQEGQRYGIGEQGRVLEDTVFGGQVREKSPRSTGAKKKIPLLSTSMVTPSVGNSVNYTPHNTGKHNYLQVTNSINVACMDPPEGSKAVMDDNPPPLDATEGTSSPHTAVEEDSLVRSGVAGACGVDVVRREGGHTDIAVPPPPTVMTSTPLRSGGDDRAVGTRGRGRLTSTTSSGTPRALLDRRCTHKKGGYCLIHGGGLS